ncbi:hypothetical protein VSDG_05638 [Cytospora chrysosperma]|uniref:Uncharacterized protein n=1 Tax=Cytospora chrysosperma TaxID=252740 RepID=A0A423W017_CYTCH|nr:hypothetical protein VSDG_05638 [Valsa sordida]
MSGTLIIEPIYGCASRTCLGTHYACATTLGGGCCPYGSNCINGGLCLSPSITNGSPSTMTAYKTNAAAGSPAGSENGLKIGLGVGLPVAVLASGALIFAWHIRRSKKRRGQKLATDDNPEYRKPELPDDPVIMRAELETGRTELPAQILAAELPEEGIMAELPEHPVSLNSAAHA